jgi:glycosyltransferase involved in cell wall biosynthesis
MEAIERYLKDHAEEYTETLPPVSGDLRLCIVIPALAERENIGAVLASLSEKDDRFEVIVVVNHKEGASPEIMEDNAGTVGDVSGRALVIERVFAPDVAGVGAARRAGMDLALRRLVEAGKPEKSAIACLDADSPVDPGYVEGILAVFGGERPPAAGICACRHPIPEDEEQARAIVAYELWLRYMEQGFRFRFCGSPYAFQTIGSCTVVSPHAYALADGMPRRQAGEDFYFLQKIAKVFGRVVDLDVTVRPSARVSDRVPFGTGRAMRRCRDEGADYYLQAEPPRAFLDLKKFFESSRDGFSDPDRMRAPPFLQSFIEKHGGWAVLDDIRENSADADHFAFGVHTWFDSLQVVRYARRCKAEYGGMWILDALKELGFDVGDELEPALQRMRRMKRSRLA